VAAAIFSGNPHPLLEVSTTSGVFAPWTLPSIAVSSSGSGPLGKPPANRGTIPPSQFADRITSTKFNNPNTSTYKGANTSAPAAWQNFVGPRTYIQFVLDYGRDDQVANRYSPVSLQAPDCPQNSDTVAGRTFSFPPAEQPMHACRRAIIAAMNVVETRNSTIPNATHRDWVSVVSFDKGKGAILRHQLDGDYVAAMQSCVGMQATGDAGYSTTTDAGLALAHTHLNQKGRERADKVVVLLTDGAPNDWVSNTSTVQAYALANNSSGNFYNNGGTWLDAALMESHMMEAEGFDVWPIGIGLGTNYDFMDRLGRLGGTADNNGQSPRGSGNPAEYEERLVDIFEHIILTPNVQLVD
jgi:hypothetical protein